MFTFKFPYEIFDVNHRMLGYSFDLVERKKFKLSLLLLAVNWITTITQRYQKILEDLSTILHQIQSK
jgi:hypothetical protein